MHFQTDHNFSHGHGAAIRMTLLGTGSEFFAMSEDKPKPAPDAEEDEGKPAKPVGEKPDHFRPAKPGKPGKD